MATIARDRASAPVRFTRTQLHDRPGQVMRQARRDGVIEVIDRFGDTELIILTPARLAAERESRPAK